MIKCKRVKKRMPNFLIAGVQRGGTTSINRMLNQHPEIYIPRKEVHFFDKHYHKGIDWYKRHFAGYRGGLCGEKTPEYIYFEECLQRIQKHHPEMKFIVSLRNPVERAISYYKANRQLRSIPVSIAQIQGLAFTNKTATLKNYSHLHFIERGKYYDQLFTFRDYFDMSQLHIIIFEQFQKQPVKEIQKVFDFLNVKQYTIKRIKINNTKKDKHIENRFRELLKNYYKPDNELLFKLLGFTIKEWK